MKFLSVILAAAVYHAGEATGEDAFLTKVMDIEDRDGDGEEDELFDHGQE